MYVASFILAHGIFKNNLVWKISHAIAPSQLYFHASVLFDQPVEQLTQHNKGDRRAVQRLKSVCKLQT